MFKVILVLLFVATSLPAQSLTEQKADSSSQLKWEQAFVLRARVMEKKFGIKFDAEWKPKVVFGVISEETSTSPRLYSRLLAMYRQISQSFLVTPIENSEINFFTTDHELGHALVDQLSRRYGYGMWPSIEKFKSLEWDEQIGIRIVDEGLATYFGYENLLPSQRDGNNGADWLPEGINDIRWTMINYRYNGGHWLVAPIVDRFGERGIVYLITHPLRFKDGKVRTAGKKYQREALKQLANNPLQQRRP